MTPEDANKLQQRVQALENLLANLTFNGEYRFLKNVKFGPNATLIQTGNFEFGSSGSKLGFYGVGPVNQQAAVTSPSGGATIDSQARTAINALIAVDHNIGITL